MPLMSPYLTALQWQQQQQPQESTPARDPNTSYPVGMAPAAPAAPAAAPKRSATSTTTNPSTGLVSTAMKPATVPTPTVGSPTMSPPDAGAAPLPQTTSTQSSQAPSYAKRSATANFDNFLAAREYAKAQPYADEKFGMERGEREYYDKTGITAASQAEQYQKRQAAYAAALAPGQTATPASLGLPPNADPVVTQSISFLQNLPRDSGLVDAAPTRTWTGNVDYSKLHPLIQERASQLYSMEGPELEQALQQLEQEIRADPTNRAGASALARKQDLVGRLDGFTRQQDGSWRGSDSSGNPVRLVQAEYDEIRQMERNLTTTPAAAPAAAPGQWKAQAGPDWATQAANYYQQRAMRTGEARLAARQKMVERFGTGSPSTSQETTNYLKNYFGVGGSTKPFVSDYQRQQQALEQQQRIQAGGGIALPPGVTDPRAIQQAEKARAANAAIGAGQSAPSSQGGLLAQANTQANVAAQQQAASSAGAIAAANNQMNGFLQQQAALPVLPRAAGPSSPAEAAIMAEMQRVNAAAEQMALAMQGNHPVTQAQQAEFVNATQQQLAALEAERLRLAQQQTAR